MLQGNWIFLPALKCSFVRGLFSREAASGSPQAPCSLCNYTAEQSCAITQPLPFKCRKSFCKHSLNNLHNNLADKVHMLIVSEHHRLRHRRFKDLLRVTLWGSMEVTGDFPLITQCQFLYATSSIWILNDWCHPSIPAGRNPRVRSECKNTLFWYKHTP